MGGVQVGQSSVRGDRPLCPRDSDHRVHRHGTYGHYRDCQSAEKERVPRYLCVWCRTTISVVADSRLPYRSVSLEVVKQWLDWALGGGPAPPVAGERERGCASRAVRCFVRHSPVLGTALGQIVRDVGAGAASLWRTLVRLSKTEPILRFLQAKLKPEADAAGRRGFSLVGTYRCLAGGQPIFSVE